MGRFSTDPAARELLIALEKGELEEDAFELQFAALLGVEPDGLIDGLFAGVHPDAAMVEAVAQARAAGVRTALVSNSWGVHRYPHELFDELFDGVVISAEEGIRKPSRRMYELGAERAGVAPEDCVYVDDLPFNLTPAAGAGHGDRSTTRAPRRRSPQARAAARRRSLRPTTRQTVAPAERRSARPLRTVALAAAVEQLEQPGEQLEVRALYGYMSSSLLHAPASR